MQHLPVSYFVPEEVFHSRAFEGGCINKTMWDNILWLIVIAQKRERERVSKYWHAVKIIMTYNMALYMHAYSRDQVILIELSRFQDRSLCLQRPSWSWSDIPQPHLQSCPRGRCQGSCAICYSRRPDCALIKDSLLWAQKLPSLGTGRLELAARGHSNSGTVAGTFQIYLLKTDLFRQAYA